MNYADAFKIGSKCDGYIKPNYAYAAVYTKKGSVYTKIFSIQKSDVNKKKKISGVGLIEVDKSKITIPAITRTQVFTDTKAAFESKDMQIEIDKSNGAVAELEYELPIVVASRYDSNPSFVPVNLTDKGLEVIIEKLKKINTTNGSTATKKQYSVYWLTKKRIGGKRGKYIDEKVYLIKETYKIPEIKQEDGFVSLYLNGVLYGKYEKIMYIESKDVIQPKYDALIESLNTDGILYVKPGDFDWIAADIKNATTTTTTEDGKTIEINLNDAIEAARKRMETAKAILATAATLTII